MGCCWHGNEYSAAQPWWGGWCYSRSWIDNPEITLDELLTHIKGPDFPTGAEVYGGANASSIWNWAWISYGFRAVTDWRAQNGRQYYNYQFRVGMSKEGFVDKVRELVLPKNNAILPMREMEVLFAALSCCWTEKDAIQRKSSNQLYKLTGLQNLIPLLMFWLC